MLRTVLFLVLALGISSESAAEEIEFSQDELARESVLPVFDRPSPVMNRNVTKADKLEVTPFVGFKVNDPFYQGTNAGIDVGLHLNERHAFHGLFSYFSSDKSKYSLALEEGDFQNFDDFPTVEWLLMGSYEYTPFYGKMSFTKQAVFNLDTFFTGGAGLISIGGETGIAGAVGLGQRYYFSKTIGLRADFRGLMYNGPDYTSVQNTAEGQQAGNDVPDPEIGDFEKEFTMHFMLTFGLVILI